MVGILYSFLLGRLGLFSGVNSLLVLGSVHENLSHKTNPRSGLGVTNGSKTDVLRIHIMGRLRPISLHLSKIS